MLVQVLYYIVGEGHTEVLFEFVGLALQHYHSQGQISPHTLPLCLEKDKQQESPLHFPGKVHVGPGPDQLVVSDSGHHRLLVLDRVTGVVQVSDKVVGGVFVVAEQVVSNTDHQLLILVLNTMISLFLSDVFGEAVLFCCFACI